MRSDLPYCCRLFETEETFWRRHDVGRRTVFAEISGPEQVTSDPSKPVCASRGHKTTINDGLNGSGKTRTAAEVVFHCVAQGYELPRLRVFNGSVQSNNRAPR
jgi:hypothetical protein